MAARNPTSWTQYVDHRLFYGGKKILEAELDKAYNDQVYTLDAEQLAISDCWHRTAITSTDAFPATAGDTAAQLVRRWYFMGKDLCDVDGYTASEGFPYSIYVLAWVTGGATFELRATSGAAASNQDTESSTVSTATWIEMDDIYCRTNNTEEYLVLEGRISSGSGTLYVAGLALYANET